MTAANPNAVLICLICCMQTRSNALPAQPLCMVVSMLAVQ
ncbi:Uncharacterised protein [Segatella copri]|nr:Uncharacterised protein [Segatella copri]